MRILTLSDTHGLHHKIPSNWLKNDGDIKIDTIIHAGDISNIGKLDEIEDFCKWYDTLDFTNKIFIAGNHCWGFQRQPKEVAEIISKYPSITYLQDSSIIIDGVKIYGSPWQPEFYSWAFNLKRGKQIQEKWDMIDLDTDILCTHGPAYDILDECPDGRVVGCQDLLNTIQTKLNNMSVHVCGHIHGAYGFEHKHGKLFINASTLSERYTVAHKPILIDFNKETKEVNVIKQNDL